MIIDPDKRTVSFDGQTVRLSQTVFAVLEYLAAHPGVIRNRTQIMHAAFPGGGMESSYRCVDTAIKRLRKLGIPGIQTYYGGGYFWEMRPG